MRPRWITWPPVEHEMRSAKTSASEYWWETITVVRLSRARISPELLLDLVPGLDVERRERLVEQQQLGCSASARAIATRCC